MKRVKLIVFDHRTTSSASRLLQRCQIGLGNFGLGGRVIIGLGRWTKFGLVLGQYGGIQTVRYLNDRRRLL